MPATSRWSPMAAPGRCTRSRSRARSASATSSFPTRPGVFSAFGMLFSDLRYDFVRTWFTRLEDAPFERIERGLPRAGGAGPRGDRRHARSSRTKITLKRAARHALCRPGARGHRRPADQRCSQRQDRAAIKRHFDAMHELRYGTSAPDERAEIVSLRSTVTGVMRKPPQEKISARHERARQGRRSPASGRSIFDGRFRPTPTYRARRAARRQPDRRAGADRGACLDHGADAGRPARGRCLRQSGHQGGGRPLTAMAKQTEPPRQVERQRPRRRRAAGQGNGAARSIRSSPRSCATASSR